jgi:hypothetical protein
LARCKQHKTQNANESFHQTMWTRCSKIKKNTPSARCVLLLQPPGRSSTSVLGGSRP